MTGFERARRGVLGLAVAVALAACSSGDPFEPLPEPENRPAPSTSTTAVADFRNVVLPPVDGTTTTTEVVIGPGPATLAGRVDGPEGPVEGATVRLERMVGDASAGLDVLTGPDGSWRAPGLLGGRYRIRAWRSPGLAMLEPQILFVEAARPAAVALVLERLQSLAVDIALAPDPPIVGAPVNLLVRISSQIVGDDGVVRATPQAGVGLVLGSGSGWAARSPVQVSTDIAGNATFTLICRAPGPQALTVTLPGSVAAPPDSLPVDSGPPAPRVFSLSPPDCVAPPPPPPAPPSTAASTSLLPSDG
ncbi:MAG TPA: carboxypeptidase-like regulatory domain-containing protein [Acidimicrobiales bacterium]|nr:carboxypeptidase-like regulatory domain-containing protein [Acidimicrobiales bacterium]